MLAPTARERLLDAGCGVGEVARQLGAAVGQHGSVVALDRSAEMISIAESRHDGSPVTYAVGDIMSLDFPAGYFSGVRCERVLQHLADPDAAIRELVRVTRPGGRVCVIDTDWTSLVYDGFDGMDDFLSSLDVYPMRGKQSGRTIRARMSRVGLESVATLPVTLRFTTPEDAAPVIKCFDHQLMSKSGTAPDDVSERYWSAITEAAEQNCFLVALTMWISQGRVPHYRPRSASSRPPL
jgi:SAM-dependent methyltransferase